MAKKRLRVPVNNRIRYFIPCQVCLNKNGHVFPSYQTKKDLLQAMGVKVVDIDIPHSEAYYVNVLKSR